MHDKIRELIAAGPVVTDGAWGTEFQKRGLGPGESPDPWNLSRPETVLEIAGAYVNAGSQVILSNTFRANRLTLAAHGMADRAAEINRAGARLSRQAANGRARVFASMGPSGKLLMAGEVTEEELYAAFAEQAAALAEGGADAILIETMADPAEAAIAVRAAKQTGLPVAASMVFDSGRNKDRTMMGTTPERAAAALAEAGADIVGANCGCGIAGYVEICRRIHAATDLPVWIKANAGLQKVMEGRTVYRMSPEEFATYVPKLLDAGASFIGGCCGTSPEFINAVRKALTEQFSGQSLTPPASESQLS